MKKNPGFQFQHFPRNEEEFNAKFGEKFQCVFAPLDQVKLLHNAIMNFKLALDNKMRELEQLTRNCLEKIKPETQASILLINLQKQLKQGEELSVEVRIQKFFTAIRSKTNDDIVKELQTLMEYGLKNTQEGTATYRILEFVKKALYSDHSSAHKIQEFYESLMKKPKNSPLTCLQHLQADTHRSTKRVVAGILSIAAIIIFGIVPGLIVMGAVYAKTKKLPHHLLRSFGQEVGISAETINVVRQQAINPAAFFKQMVEQSKHENSVDEKKNLDL